MASCRSLNPYVANSFGGWAVPHRLPIQASPMEAASAGTSSFGMSGVNAHAIVSPPAAAASQAAATLAAAPWQRSLRCFVDVLVPLHPLLGAAVKVGGHQGRLLCCCMPAMPHARSAARLSWLPANASCTEAGATRKHELLLLRASATRPMASPPPLQAKQQLQFRLALGRAPLAFLRDHQVQASAIMPGAAYLEMAAAAGRTLLRLPEPALALAGAVIAAPLRLPGVPHAGAAVLTADVALSTGDITIRSAGVSSGSAAGGGKAGKPGSKAAVAHETLHLRGSLTAVTSGAVAALVPAADASGLAVSADAARAACPTPMDAAAVYSGLHAAGLQYGPAFRRLRSIQQGADGASAGLAGSCSCQEQDDADVSGFLMHPAALDSCLQLGALVPDAASAGGDAQQQGAFVPVGLAAYLIQQPLRQGSGSLAVVQRSPEAVRRTAGATYRDHRLLSGSGAVLAVLDGLEAKQLPGSGGATVGGLTAGSKQQQPEVLYEVAWQASALAGGDCARASSAPSTLALALPRRSVVPLEAVSDGLLALQGAMQRQAGAVRLTTVDDVPAGLAASQAADGSALWGLLRAFAAEAPAVAHGGARTDPTAPGNGNTSARLEVSNGPVGSASDGYGSRARAGAALRAVLLPTRAVCAAAGPFHLMPKPRGAFRCASRPQALT